VDDLDARIVALLAGDGRMTHRELAQRTGLSRSAAGARLTRLLGVSLTLSNSPSSVIESLSCLL